MKRFVKTLLMSFLILASLSIAALALDSIPKVSENELAVISFNGPKPFLKDEVNPQPLEDAAYWIIDNKESLNVKYVSYLGEISGGANYTYYNYSKKIDELNTANASDKAWQDEFQALMPAIKALKEDGIPVGLSYGIYDTYANAFIRGNNQAAMYPVSDIMPDDATYDLYDNSNYYTIVENNGQKYIIFQLELWPQNKVLDWVDTVMKQNQDKYAIVFTHSMIDATGTMYKMWDWVETGGKIAISGATSYMRSCNIANYNQPVDGDMFWKYCISKYDNILAVITSYVSTDDIVMTKATNPNGFDTALIAANMSGLANTYGPMALLTSFSEDHKTITCDYLVPFEGTLKSKSITLSSIGTLAEPLTNDSLPQVALQYNGANKAYIFGYEGNTFRPQANMTRAEACTIFARLILGVQTIPDGYTTRFEDVERGDWFYNAVAYLDETGFFFRNKNTTYKPNQPITRAEFVDLANSASALAKGDDAIAFADVPEDHFYYTSIMAAAGAGLVNGYEDNTFRPDNTITRAEVVTVINRLLGLKATSNTVSLSHLENEFVDIKTHWARLNILMASNSNVHGDYYYEKSLDRVSENASSYTFENKHFSFTVAKKNGKVTKIVNKYTDEDINLPSSNYQFIHLVTESGAQVIPTAMETEGNRIKVTFKNGAVVYLLVEVNDTFMTFEIDSDLATGDKQIVFGVLKTNVKVSSDPESFRIGLVGMSAWVNPAKKGYGNHNEVYATAFPKCPSGSMGAKIGITFGKQGNILKQLQEVLSAIDPAVGITGTTGAAYSKEYAPLSGDYWIISNVNDENVDKLIEVCLAYGIDQADIHQNRSTSHRAGDFYFGTTDSGTAKEFYEKYGKKFEEAGIMTGLHTYAYYIDYAAVNILSDPKWVKDLDTLEEYTLRKDMSATARNIPTVESASGFSLASGFFVKNSPYVLVDSEIMRVGSGTSSGLLNVTRGACGTTPTVHKAGAKVKHLSGYFQMLVPKLGSDLFYHIADLTAQAYNDGGFGMIYLDAIDGLAQHTESSLVWYYFQMFVQRITSQCKVSPILETSSGGPQEWNIRGRAGAYDYPSRGYNQFNAGHIDNNKQNMDFNFITTLGWYNFLPDGGSTYKNTIARTQFLNNLDYMGYQSIVYNMTMVWHGVGADSIDNNPYLRANLDYYNKYYSLLRKNQYFSDEAIAKVKASGSEFKVIEKAPGEYAFLEMYYSSARVGKLSEDDYTFKADNKLGEQAPFIRIEQIFSTLYENPIVLAKFDENKTVGEQTRTFNLSTTNLSTNNNYAITVKVKGTGVDGDAMLISLLGSGSTGRADYFIDLNFDGWRDVILTTVENGEYNTSKYSFEGITLSGGNFASFVTSVATSATNKVEVRLSGKTASSAQIGNISACTIVDAPAKNPTITIGNDKITFNATVKSGEYIEYYPETGKAILYHAYDQTTEEITYTGAIKSIPNGSFTGTYSAEGTGAARLKAIVNFGFSGIEITN